MRRFVVVCTGIVAFGVNAGPASAFSDLYQPPGPSYVTGAWNGAQVYHCNAQEIGGSGTIVETKRGQVHNNCEVGGGDF
jgi:hypothetical protein